MNLFSGEMDFPNQGSSVYYEIQCTYIRQSEGELLTVEGRCAEKVRAIWPQIWHTKTTCEGCIERKILSSGDETAVYELDISKTPYNQAIQPNLPHEEHSACSNEGSVVRLHELHRQGQREVIGVLSLTSARGHSLKDNFRDWAGLYILSESRICAPVHEIGMDASKSKDLAERITVLFELRLRNVAPHDAWISGGGRKYFLNRVLAFVERKARVEFCLPAFPCKSSNPLKTSGVHPDKAEVIALEALRHFVRGVTEIYEPGAKVWIISDGHVFSDCSELQAPRPLRL
jgi:Pyoverdine/dityrosine biosynthesis protein